MREAPGRVLGMHIVGPNAAEIIQGYAVALNAGITFEQLTGEHRSAAFSYYAASFPFPVLLFVR